MLLPDPHDADWETCLAGYRHARSVILNDIERLLGRLCQLEDVHDEKNEQGGFTNEEDVEMSDRLHCIAIQQNQRKYALLTLRQYIYLAQVVHKRSDRLTFDAIVKNLKEGIPPEVTRATLNKSISRDN